MSLRLYSWNVNGARSIHKRGFLNWFDRTAPDILCLQEVRAEPHQLDPALAQPLGYAAHWNPSRTRRGYSGTALLSRVRPRQVTLGLGLRKGAEDFDAEGRTIIAEYDDFFLVNAYFPNGRRDHSRVSFKLRYCELFLRRCEQLRRRGKAVIFCGDLNTSHRQIDLARPRENRNTTGFLPEERAWMDRLVDTGYVDSFRHLHPDRSGAYTWWSMPTRARERNIGWRLDYFFASPEIADRIHAARIHADVYGSDHCPVELSLRG